MSANPLLRPSNPAPTPRAFRTAPHNLEAEQALLGAILVNNEACDRVSAFLTPEHFFEARPCPHLRGGVHPDPRRQAGLAR